AALSDRPQLFRSSTGPADREAEERRRIIALFAGADPAAAASLGNAYVPSEEIERLLTVIGSKSSRVWVIDTRSRVRGLSGALRVTDPRSSPLSSWLAPIAAVFAPAPRVPAGDETRPTAGQFNRALIGVSSTQWRGTSDPQVAILSAAQPIFVGDDIVGAVVVEENTTPIQLLKESALRNLLALTLAIVALAFAILLGFATRLTTRIRRLHAEAEGAIDSQGRVRGSITATPARDEIGDLTRTTAAMLARLKDYNAYLEAMAGRLSHELRTPVAVVRSSLDNLKAQELPADARVYVERAGEGVDRLARLISRLSEATRLERLLESAERERFDLNALAAGCVEGYRAAYRGREFVYVAPPAPVWMVGAPDAFAQLLDKLIENAVDFAPPGSPIGIDLTVQGRHAILSVTNAGPPLPESLRAGLFDSLVSMRPAAAGTREAHLGLGLFIVRLVAEAHGGRVRAENLAGERGVRFEVEVLLP
ncbi:MAG: proteobacterial dedicated sortase system histidine kinase, partial [Burkholderiales bacterium]|nr:proteobacterial dedicated sortase system histidine kinase [Burkholderiales bacterium]